MNIQKALVSAGFSGVTVAVVPTTKTTNFFFKVTFGGACTGVDEAPLTYVANVTKPLPVTFAQKNVENLNSVEPTGSPGDMYTFLVNTSTANPQESPGVSMDTEGDFAIVWASEGQDISYFNDIYEQRFDYNGNRVGSETLVNTEVTANDTVPAVAMGRDGYVVVTWTETNGPVEATVGATSLVWVRGLDLQSHPLWNQIAVGIGADSSISMDGQDNFLVAWTAYTQNNDNDATGGFSPGVYGIMAQLENYSTGKPLAEPAVTRPLFRLNSASTTPSSVTDWPLGQQDSAAAVDLDGDLAVAYDGNGPNVLSEHRYSRRILRAILRSGERPADDQHGLAAVLQSVRRAGARSKCVTVCYAGEPNYTVDQAIDQILFDASTWTSRGDP